MAEKKKVEKIPVVTNRIIDILNNQKTDDSNVIMVETRDGEKNINVLINHSISLREASDFVDAVVENCFVGGVYSPIYKNLYIDRALIIYFTDLKMPENDDEMYKAINETNLIEVIKKYMSSAQLYDILQAIEAMIEFRKQQILKNSEFETMMVDLGGLISLGLEKLSQVDLTKINFEKVNGLVDGIIEQVKAQSIES